MSLLLLLTEWEPGEPEPPGDSETQHLLLALQWTPDDEPDPEPGTTQHLLLALQWEPGAVVPPETEIIEPGHGSAAWGSRVRMPGVYPEVIRKRKDEDEDLLAFVHAFVEWEETESG